MLYGRARYVIVHKTRVPVGCPRCCHWNFTWILRGTWRCDLCEWVGRPYSAEWQESAMPRMEAVRRLPHVHDRYYDRKHRLQPVGQYRMVRTQSSKNKIAVPVACPACKRHNVVRDSERTWVCSSCTWVGKVLKRTWVLVE